jgi:hypothetical protein
MAKRRNERRPAGGEARGVAAPWSRIVLYAWCAPPGEDLDPANSGRHDSSPGETGCSESTGSAARHAA